MQKMFGLGAKKQPASKTGWNIKLLTKAYLVEGSFQPKDYESGGLDVFALAAASAMAEGGLDAFKHLRLTDVRVQPTGNLASSEESFSEWGLLALDEIVAIIPNDQASLESAQKAFKDYRHPMDVVVYAGPYRIHAKLMADTADRKRSPFAMTQIIPLTDAEIECQLPGAKLTKLPVAWLLLNGSASLHGYGVL
ncbi:MAG: hypothetical protein HY782_25850 [Chloroflexi bacterium]|nr:hypothetical protein [Chloroflexota bacterium]